MIMGNASQICAYGSTQLEDNNKKDQQQRFLDKSPPQTINKALINLLDEQYSYQLLPNVKELHKYNRKKIEKVINKFTTTESHQYKLHFQQHCSTQKPRNTQNISKVKQNLRQFYQLQALKQKCKKIQLDQKELFRRKMQKQSQLKAYNQSMQVQRQKNQAMASKLKIGQSNEK